MVGRVEIAREGESEVAMDGRSTIRGAEGSRRGARMV